MSKDEHEARLRPYREELKRWEDAGVPEMVRGARNRLRHEGRKIANESGGKLGWCNHHEELHPRINFYDDPRSKMGYRSNCMAAVSTQRRGKEKPTPTKTPKGEGIQPEDRQGAKRKDTQRTRKCRRKNCGNRWTPAKGDTSRSCPPCRGRHSKKAAA